MCLKSLGISSGKDSSSKVCLNNKGSPCFDDNTNAETFKAFFSNLASDLVKTLQRSPHKLDEVRKYYCTDGTTVLVMPITELCNLSILLHSQKIGGFWSIPVGYKYRTL